MDGTRRSSGARRSFLARWLSAGSAVGACASEQRRRQRRQWRRGAQRCEEEAKGELGLSKGSAVAILSSPGAL